MGKIQKSTVDIFTVSGKDFRTLDEATAYETKLLLTELLHYCVSTEGINEVADDGQYSLHCIISVLTSNGLTSKAKLARLKEQIDGNI